MGLFHRSARKGTDARTSTQKDAQASTQKASGPETTDAPENLDAAESPDAAKNQGTGVDAAAEDDLTHLAGGPFDERDAPQEDPERIDLTGLQIPSIDGMELRLELDQRTRAVTGANLMLDGSSLQLQAFAAPTSRPLWDEVREALRTSIAEQGGTVEVREGPWGAELGCRLPMTLADGRTSYRPARFIGIDGRRWFLRAILSGPAASDTEASRRFDAILSRVVVVRGGEAMAPQEQIPLSLPGQRPGVVPADGDGIDPLARGPEITEIG